MQAAWLPIDTNLVMKLSGKVSNRHRHADAPPAKKPTLRPTAVPCRVPASVGKQAHCCVMHDGRYGAVARSEPSAKRSPDAMPFVSSSGRKLYIDGPQTTGTRPLAYLVIGAAILLSLFALIRLGNAASAAVAAVSKGVAAQP